MRGRRAGTARFLFNSRSVPRGDPLTTRLRADERHGSTVIDLWPRQGRAAGATSGALSDDGDDDRRAHARRAIDVVRSLSAQRRRGGGGESEAGTRSPRPGGLLSEEELAAIETTYPEGITAVQIVEVFTSRGVRFSEASFRKYVQQGLLPRSRRVGRKGKHRGSLGVYPPKTVRRINAVKRLMNDGYTIEEIQADFLQYTDLVENLSEGITELLGRLDRDAASAAVDGAARKALGKELAEVRRAADDVVRRLDALARKVAAPAADRIRRSGAAGSAEDLL
jgi:DNA-binding transcriptional MerR regulator